MPELIGVLCTRSAEAMVRHHEAVPVTDDPISEFLPLALAFRSGAREQADLYERLYAPTNLDSGFTVEYPPQVQRTLARVKDTISRAILAGQRRPVDDQELFQQLWRSFMASHPWSCVEYWEPLMSATASGTTRSPHTCAD
jgi:hypothetical protein